MVGLRRKAAKEAWVIELMLQGVIQESQATALWVLTLELSPPIDWTANWVVVCQCLRNMILVYVREVLWA